jgi:hypothetical protein
MGQSSSERAWASRARRSKNLSPEARERLDRYNRSRGRPGRPSTSGPSPLDPPAPAAAAASQPPLQEPPASDPHSGAGGQGGGPPIDLGAPPANDQTPPAGDGAEDAAAKAAAERAQTIKFLAAWIVQQLRAAEPLIRQAQLPLPPLPEFALAVTGKCWEVTLAKWLPEELADPTEYAELVACTTTGYQLGVAFWARKRLEARAHEVPAVDATPASSSSSAPAAAPASSPPPAPNGVKVTSKSLFAPAMAAAPPPEAKS